MMVEIIHVYIDQGKTILTKSKLAADAIYNFDQR